MTVFRVSLALGLGLVGGCTLSLDDPQQQPVELQQAAPHLFPTATLPALVTETRPVCAGTGAGPHCNSHVATENGVVKGFAAPNGFGPQDLESAYNIDVTLGAGLTVAVVDAFGYPKLESDLAMYRSTFNLPACTIASGCLKIVNDSGQTSPLPALPPSDQEDWTIETALDVDMVSSGCPMCNILVVQTSSAGNGLYVGQMVAAAAGATVISDSWGANEVGGEAALEGNFDVPGVATFASTGDSGANNGVPQYPATSVHVIAVGGTHLQTDTVDPRGWQETAWGLASSSCSNNIAKPTYQTANTSCPMRAAADVSAVADPATGLAVFDSDNGNPGWSVEGGTSAASPLTASMFAASGHGDTTPAFAYKHQAVFVDVKQGQNGSCGAPLCTAGPGWDGPTGVGSPNQAMVKAIVGTDQGPGVAITFPTDGATVAPGFTIEATSAGANMTYMQILVDGTKVGASSATPFDLSSAMSLATGMHTIQAIAFDESHDQSTTMITVDLEPAGSGSDGGGGGGGGGCAVGGGAGGLPIGLALLALRRRRK